MYEQAITPLTKAISFHKYEACYVHERAKCYLLINEFQKALDDFNTVLNLQQKNPHAYFGRGFAKKALKDYDGASEDLEMAKKLDPANPKL